MSGHDQPTVLPLAQRPIAFWLVVLPMLLLVAALVGGIFMKERAAQALLTERALRYAVDARAIDQAYEQRAVEENARRAASMQ